MIDKRTRARCFGDWTRLISVWSVCRAVQCIRRTNESSIHESCSYSSVGRPEAARALPLQYRDRCDVVVVVVSICEMRPIYLLIARVGALRRAECIDDEWLTHVTGMFSLFDAVTRRQNTNKITHKIITQTLINDYTATYSIFRNSHMRFNFQIWFSRNRTIFAATRHVPWALYTPSWMLTIWQNHLAAGAPDLLAGVPSPKTLLRSWPLGSRNLALGPRNSRWTLSWNSGSAPECQRWVKYNVSVNTGRTK